MRTPLKVDRAGAVGELTAGLRVEKRSVNQIRLRAVLAVARGEHVLDVVHALGDLCHFVLHMGSGSLFTW